MAASRAGGVAAVEALLAAGADVEAEERNGQTALMWAAAEGPAPVVEALLRRGADIRRALDSGFSAMFFAVREGRSEVVRVLIRAGVDVNEALHRKKRPRYQHANSGMSPLLLAIENGHFELAVMLLEAGADPNDERTGFTPLHTVTWVLKPKVSDDGSEPVPERSGNNSSLHFVRTLVAMGTDVNARLKAGKPQAPKINRQGATAFLFAVDKVDVPLMKVLLGLGADINAADDNGETVVHGAAYGSFPTVLQLLADSGADPSLWSRRNRHGWTPLSIAEGYRPGNFKPALRMILAIRALMAKHGLSADGVRPRQIGTCEKARLAAQQSR